MDKVERAIWNDVKMEECGCWTWKGQSGCNIVKLLAELSGSPLPANKMFRMPECQLGADCVNPSHVGTSEAWMARVRRSRNT